MLGVFFHPWDSVSFEILLVYIAGKVGAPREKLSGPELFGDGEIRPSQLTQHQDEGGDLGHKETGSCLG